MSDAVNLRDTIVPKSDQLNADDVIAGPITVTITSVKRGDKDQPVVIGIDGGRQPYKPCKSMRRVMIMAWGDNGSDWVGKSMTLFCDPAVMFGGVKVGGIRISHLSHIERDLALSLTATRGKRTPYTVQKLSVAMYDPSAFDKNLPAWRKAISDSKLTADQVISRAEQSGKLTDEQKAQIHAPVEE